MKENLPTQNIEYFHLGNLGGYRDEEYKEYMKTEKFKEGLNKLEELARGEKTTIMCLESYPSGCHRRYITEKLDEKGWKVKHLIGKEGKQKTLD